MDYMSMLLWHTSALGVYRKGYPTTLENQLLVWIQLLLGNWQPGLGLGPGLGLDLLSAHSLDARTDPSSLGMVGGRASSGYIGLELVV